MQSFDMESAIIPRSLSSKKILFPAIMNKKDLEDLSPNAADSMIIDVDLRSLSKLQPTLSCPYLTAYATNPLVLDLPFTTSSTIGESDTRKMQILHQLVADPLVVVKAASSSEAEPYQLSALRDDDRAFFYGARDGFQDVYEYVNSSAEILETKASHDAAATALLSFMRQAPAYLAIDWLEAPKQRGIAHSVVGTYTNSSVMATANVLATEMAWRYGIPAENMEALKSPVLQNAAMKATANATANSKYPIFTAEAFEKLVEWCRDSNPAKAAMMECDKSKSKDKEKQRSTKQLIPSQNEMFKTLQLVLRFIGASNDIALHAKNGYLSSADNVRLSPLIFTRGSKIGFASEWFHSIRAASFDRFERRDDRRDERQPRASNRDNRNRSRERNNEKK